MSITYSTPPHFPTAERAGLAMLGGEDVTVPFAGHDLRGHYWPVESGSSSGLVVLCPGFTEFCEKHSGTCRALHERGYDVLSIDWPGQGRSGHFGRDPLAVHIDDFDQYLDAMDALLVATGLAERDRILFGHSMGGHLALRLGARHAKKTRAIILSAPMILPPVRPIWGVRLLAGLLRFCGMGRWRTPFSRPRALEKARQFHEDNVLTSWPPGYAVQYLWMDDMPGIRRTGPTVGWVCAAYKSCVMTTMNAGWMAKLRIPVFALTAADERVVDRDASDQMLAVLPRCERHEMTAARHELMMEQPAIVAAVWNHIDRFLQQL